MVPEGASTAVDLLFRHEAGRMTSRLVRIFGLHHIDLCEDAVQDAICAALKTWKFRGIPERPGAWLMRAAHNRAIDLVRRNRRYRSILADWTGVQSDEPAIEPSREAPAETSLHDDRLVLTFSCCHPTLAIESQLALILKSALRL